MELSRIIQPGDFSQASSEASALWRYAHGDIPYPLADEKLRRDLIAAQLEAGSWIIAYLTHPNIHSKITKTLPQSHVFLANDSDTFTDSHFKTGISYHRRLPSPESLRLSVQMGKNYIPGKFLTSNQFLDVANTSFPSPDDYSWQLIETPGTNTLFAHRRLLPEDTLVGKLFVPFFNHFHLMIARTNQHNLLELVGRHQTKDLKAWLKSIRDFNSYIDSFFSDP